MLTAQDGARLLKLKATLKKHGASAISAADTQWMLDKIAQERCAIKATVIHRAHNSGFDVSNIIRE